MLTLLRRHLPGAHVPCGSFIPLSPPFANSRRLLYSPMTTVRVPEAVVWPSWTLSSPGRLHQNAPFASLVSEEFLRFIFATGDHTGCEEAYGSNGHLYACQTGCNVTTIDQKVPNRDQSYQTTGTNELGFVLELFEAVSSQLQTGGSQMDDLTQQAETMYQLLPGGAKVSTIVIIQENVSLL